MSAFSGEQRPGAADAGAIEGRAVFVFAVSIAVVAVPARALRELHAQQSVDDANRIQNAGIIGGAQSEADQSQRIGTDDAKGALRILAGRTILDGDEALRGRGGGIGNGRSDANVVAFHADLVRRDRRPWRRPSVRCCRSRRRLHREEWMAASLSGR